MDFYRHLVHTFVTTLHLMRREHRRVTTIPVNWELDVLHLALPTVPVIFPVISSRCTGEPEDKSPAVGLGDMNKSAVV